MKIIKLIMLALLLCSCASAPVTNDTEDLGYQGKFDNKGSNVVLDTLDKLKQNTDAEIRMENGWTIVDLNTERSLWSFAPESHPAYPSFAKRQVQEKDGNIGIATSVTCGASKEVCDSFVKDFMELNEKVKQELNSQ